MDDDRRDKGTHARTVPGRRRNSRDDAGGLLRSCPLRRRGYYNLTFDGYMASAPLYDELSEGKLLAAGEAEKVARLEADIIRDKAVEEFEYIKQGHFKIRWHKEGDLLRVKSVTFLRSNERIVSLRYVRDSGLVTLQGAAIAKSNARRLVDMGLNIQGQLRVRTDAEVVSHNATLVKGTEVRTYVWNVKSAFDPAPKLVLNIR
jgi:hypothetical protein